MSTDSNAYSQYPGTAGAPGVPGRRRLTRNTRDSWIGGVAAGLADYMGIDAAIVRVLFVASLLLPGPQILLYLILWIVIPRR